MKESVKIKLLLFGIIIVLIAACSSCASVKNTSKTTINVDACPKWVACKPIKF